MFENIEVIWVEIRQGDTKYLVSCIYKPPSATTEYYEKIVDMFECARMNEHPVISLCDLNFNYILDETWSTIPIHHIETAYDMHQLIDQPTRMGDKTSSVLDVILTSHPTLHRKSAVLKYTLSDHYLIYNHREFENTKPSVVDHNTVKFHDMKNFRYGEFLQWTNFMWHSNWFPGQWWCIMGKVEISIYWYMWLTRPNGKFKTEKKTRSNPWMTHDNMKLVWARPCMYTPRLHKAMIQNYDKITVKLYGINWRVLSRSERMMSIWMLFIHCTVNDPPKMWSEIKRLVPGKNKYSHITCDIFANDFNHQFCQYYQQNELKISKFLWHFFSGKAQKVFIVFFSRRCLMKILLHI